MSGTRTSAAIGAVAAAVIGGGLLYVTAPATSLVDAPKYEVPQQVTDSIDTTVTPEVSDFYDVGSWQPGPPGTLVKAEPIAGDAGGAHLYRIMYQSTDLQGNAIPVTGLYAVPDGPAPPGGFPLIGFAHGTTGVGRACGMSQAPLTPNTPGYSAWVPHIQPLVEQGWAVVASDYSGLGAPGPGSYLVGPLEGRGVLDSMRAVLTPDARIGSVAVNDTQLGIYGKSQGGEAALSAMELAATYAPELDIAGGVALAPGFTPALQGILDVVAGNPTSTSQNMFVMLIAKSFADSYPDLVDLDDVLTDEGKRRVALLETNCGTDLADRMSDVPLNKLLQVPVDSGLVTALNKAMPGSVPLEMPALILQGLKDKTILPQFTHAQVMSRCALGDTVMYVRYPYDDHPSLNYQARETQPSAIDWMQARWAGEPAPDNCANQLLGTTNTATGVNG
ncbi:MAG TPA: lipase family protein [Actinomycetota bacterium]|nr:lipase family protein [Actinomycetota bacterium]